MICRANQLPGFYVTEIYIDDGLKAKLLINKFTNFCLVELTFTLFEDDAAHEKRIHDCENSQTKQEEDYISKLFTVLKPIGIKHEVYFTTGTII